MIELEKYILGACMLDNSVIIEFMRLKEEMFSNAYNRVIFRSIMALSRACKPIDIISVSSEVKKHDKADYAYITQLTSNVGSARGIEHKITQLIEIYTEAKFKEKMYNIINDLNKKNYEDFGIFMESSLSGLGDIFNVFDRNEAKHITEIIKDISSDINRVRAGVSIDTVKTGINSIDSFFGGFENTDLIIIAARPSVGKSALAKSIALQSAMLGNCIAIFSLEMSAKQIAIRILSEQSRLNPYVLKNRMMQIEYDAVDNAIIALDDANILIDDTSAISSFELKSKIKRMLVKYKVKMAIIDYIQLMTSDVKNGNRENEVSKISRDLKKIAKDCNIPLIALSQLNRSLEARQDKTPRLSDLRESGSIEQDADIVIFIHRPEIYGINEFADGTSTDSKAELIIAKNRNGQTGSIFVEFDKKTVSFKDADEIPF